MQPLTGPYVYGVNRRSESFLLLSDLRASLISTSGSASHYTELSYQFLVCEMLECYLFVSASYLH